MFVATKFSEADYTAAQRITKMIPIPKSASEVKRIRDLFKECCRLSGVSFAEGFVPFVGNLIHVKVKPGTVKTYSQYVWPLIGNPDRALGDFKRGIDAYVCEEDPHDPKKPLPTVVLYDCMMALENVSEMVGCFLGFAIGLRPINNHRVRRRGFMWREDEKDALAGFYRAMYTFTKNRRKTT